MIILYILDVITVLSDFVNKKRSLISVQINKLMKILRAMYI